MELKIFRLNRIRWSEMYDDAKVYLQSVYNQDDQVFSLASPFGQLLQVILYLGNMIFYYIEDSITEMNINTATRTNSIQGIARTTGHNPVRSIAASGTVRISFSKEVDMYGNELIIPNRSRMTCNENGLIYVLDLPSEDARIVMTPLSDPVLAIIKQGVYETSSVYTGTGQPLQSFTVQASNGRQIDMEDVHVRVNGIEWKAYDSIYDMNNSTKGCLVKTSLTDGIDVFFGNGYYGRIPAYGDQITVSFLTTLGMAGNITNYQSVSFKMIDPCYDIQGNEVDASEALTITADTSIAFGTDQEPINLTKLLAPRMSRSFVLANTDNYIYFLEKFNYFSYIDAYTVDDIDVYADPDDRNSVNNSNVVYLVLIPDINKRKETSDNYFTVSQDYFLLTEEEKTNIYNLIERSGQRCLNVVNKIIDPIIRRYALNVSLRIFESFSEDLIRSQVVAKVSEYLLANQRRDRIPKSDLIAIIEGIEGVDSVNVWFTSENYENYLRGDHSIGNSYFDRFDEFGDIVLKEDEIALIRGGWYDRNNVLINDGVHDDKPCACNVIVEEVVTPTYNTDKHKSNVKYLK